MKASLAFLAGIALMWGVASIGQYQTALVITSSLQMARELRAQCQRATFRPIRGIA